MKDDAQSLVPAALPPRSRHRAADADDNEPRALSAVRLWLAGASHDTIAKELGYVNGNRVRDVIERALAQSVEDSGDIPRARALRRKQLEELVRVVMPTALKPSHKEHRNYVHTAAALIDRLVKLDGLDAPVQVKMEHTMAHEEIRSWVEKAVQITGTGPSQEASIFDDEDIVDAEVES